MDDEGTEEKKPQVASTPEKKHAPAARGEGARRGRKEKAASAKKDSSSSTSTTTSTDSSSKLGGKAKKGSKRQSGSKKASSGEKKAPASEQPHEEEEKKNVEAEKAEEQEEKKSPEEDDDDDSDEGEKLENTTPALRFSRSGGFGAFGGFTPMGHGRFGNLLTALQSGDEGQQMEAVMELSDFLCMATEESMGGFHVDRFVPAITSLLHMEHNNEIMLLAARALAHLVEALPAAAANIVRSDAVPTLCDKLMLTEFIDLKEQIILTLEKLSWEHPTPLLRAGAVAAIFTFLDFFDIGVQRTGMSTIANICRQVPSDQFHLLTDVLGQMTDMLQYSDQKMVESACLGFCRLIENFVGDEERVETIVSRGLLPRVLKLIAGEGNVTLDQNMVSQLLRMLGYICRSSPSLTITLLEEGVLNTIQHILLGPEATKRADKSPATPSLSRLSRDQLADVLSLIHELLPTLPPGVLPTFAAAGHHYVPSNPFLRRSLGLMRALTGETQPTKQEEQAQVKLKKKKHTKKKGRKEVDSKPDEEEEKPEESKRKSSKRHGGDKKKTKKKTKAPTPEEEEKASGEAEAMEREGAAEEAADKKPSSDSMELEEPGQKHDDEEEEEEEKSLERQQSEEPEGDDDDDEDEDEDDSEEEEEEEEKIESSSSSTQPSGSQPEEEAEKPKSDPRAQMFEAHPGLLSSIGESLLGILERLYITIVHPGVRERCLTTITKILYFSTPDMLTESMKSIAFSRFLAHLLSTSGSDQSPVVRGLVLAEILMQKLPDIFIKYFRREGVINEIEKLASASSSAPSTPVKSEASKDEQTERPLSLSRHHHQQDDMKEEMTKWIVEHARQLMDTHFHKTSGAATDELKRMTDLARKLKSQESIDELTPTLKEIAALLVELSTYEMLGSGLIERLVEYLTRLDASPAPQCYDNRLERVKSFATIFLDLHHSSSSSSSPSPSTTGVIAADPPLPPIVTLVRQLHEALDKEESFKVAVYDAMGNASSLKLLSQPLRFKLQRHGPFENKEEEKQYEQPESLMIEPLASVEDIAQFVWQSLVPQKFLAATASVQAAQRREQHQQQRQQLKLQLQAKRREEAAKEPPAAKDGEEPTQLNRKSRRQLKREKKKEEKKRMKEEKKQKLKEQRKPLAAAESSGGEEQTKKIDADANAAAAAGKSVEPDCSPMGDAAFFERMKAIAADVHAQVEQEEKEQAEKETRGEQQAEEGEEEEEVIMKILPQGSILDEEEEEDFSEEEEDEEAGAEEGEGRPPSSFAELLSRMEKQYGLQLGVMDGDEPQHDDEDDDEEDEDLDDEEALAAEEESESPSALESDRMEEDEEAHDGNEEGEKEGGLTAKGTEAEVAAALDSGESSTRPAPTPDEDKGSDVSAPAPSTTKPVAPKKATAPSKATHKLEIFLDGNKVELAQSIFEILPKPQPGGEADQLPVHHLWQQEHNLTFTLTPLNVNSGNTTEEVASSTEMSDAVASTSTSTSTTTTTTTTTSTTPSESNPPAADPFALTELGRPALERFLGLVAPAWLRDEGASETTLSILNLLRVLDAINRLWSSLFTNVTSRAEAEDAPNCRINPSEFISPKLTGKLSRQLQDPITVCSHAFPRWCHELAAEFAFLFPFDTRRQFLNSTSFGVSRALKNLKITIHGQPLQVPRLTHNKVAISRQHILQAAQKVMALYAGHKAVLEVGYFNEVGVGAGPTLEFYTMVSHELQKRKLGLWLDQDAAASSAHVAPMHVEGATAAAGEQGSNDAQQYTFHPAGLFPALLSPNAPAARKSEVEKLFQFVGRFVGKAILDGWQLDFPLSDPFFKVMTGEQLGWEDLRLLFPSYEKSLRPLLQLSREKLRIQRDASLSAAERAEKVAGLRLEGRRVEDLYLDFSLPGFADWELKPHGADVDLTVDNVDEYVTLTVKALLHDGVRLQLDAFRQGFAEVFAMGNLRIFTHHELKALICGLQDDSENWLPHVLMEHTKTDHGYHENSRAVKYLLEVLVELTPEQRRKFLLWVTGSPRLPIGGWKDLVPKLTIVRKEATDRSQSADEFLPSVMTCFNYLKLPDYSSKEVLKGKLLLAINEGAEFHLS